MTYLGRDSYPASYPHSETGFIGFNLLHEQFASFIKTAISFYTTGEIFALKRYHDCVVYDTTRSIFEMAGNKFRNLSGKFTSDDHPFVKCELGNYFDHLKGQRKTLGFSPEHPKNNDKSKIEYKNINMSIFNDPFFEASSSNHKWQLAMPTIKTNIVDSEIISTGIIPSLISWKSEKPIYQMKKNQFELISFEIELSETQQQFNNFLNSFGKIEYVSVSMKTKEDPSIFKLKLKDNLRNQVISL